MDISPEQPQQSTLEDELITFSAWLEQDLPVSNPGTLYIERCNLLDRYVEEIVQIRAEAHRVWERDYLPRGARFTTEVRNQCYEPNRVRLVELYDLIDPLLNELFTPPDDIPIYIPDRDTQQIIGIIQERRAVAGRPDATLPSDMWKLMTVGGRVMPGTLARVPSVPPHDG